MNVPPSYVHRRVAVQLILPLGSERTDHTATRPSAYRFGTLDAVWQCGWHCPVRSPSSGSATYTATRAWACSPTWAALPLGP